MTKKIFAMLGTLALLSACETASQKVVSGSVAVLPTIISLLQLYQVLLYDWCKLRLFYKSVGANFDFLISQWENFA